MSIRTPFSAFFAPMLVLALTGCPEDESAPTEGDAAPSSTDAGDADGETTTDGSAGAQGDGGASGRDDGGTRPDDGGAVSADASDDAGGPSVDGGADASADGGSHDASADSGDLDAGSDAGSDADAGSGGASCSYDTDCAESEWCQGDVCVPAVYCGGGAAWCPEDNAVCDRLRSLCTECVMDADCPASHHCVDSERCEPFDSCVNTLGCPAGEVCDTDAGECVGCVQDADCADGELCDGASCYLRCDSDNDCRDAGLLCVPASEGEATRCGDCNSDVDCDASEFCEAGACLKDRCVPGEQRCGGARFDEGVSAEDCQTGPYPERDACYLCWEFGYCTADYPPTGPTGDLTVCDARGAGFVLRSNCGSGLACLQGGGASECVDQVCVANSRFCEDAQTAAVCSPDGMEATATPCADGELCFEGECGPVICEADVRRCANDQRGELCEPNGTQWITTSECDASQYCSDATTECLPLERTEDVMPFASFPNRSISGPGLAGVALSMSDERALLSVEVPGLADQATGSVFTFRVYRQTGADTFTPVGEAVRTIGDANCVAGDGGCIATFDGLVLDAGETYLLGVYVPDSQRYAPAYLTLGGFSYATGFGGTVAGTFDARSDALPSGTLTTPIMPLPTGQTLDEIVAMRFTMARPD